jgi:hypothetical protein
LQFLKYHRNQSGKDFLGQKPVFDRGHNARFKFLGIKAFLGTTRLPFFEFSLAGVISEPSRLGGAGNHFTRELICFEWPSQGMSAMLDDFADCSSLVEEHTCYQLIESRVGASSR